ncbi:hypothetical protein CTAYLR_005248 [Chrysophaeum taylorii]|uniref:Uncharacterized protein n=1 Tax=Chrysophaeum taylorii TaxID=2483200 RepID=A0AAD7UB38_9STRA|nr:hypothetical protein CTAYLR_005248 [Chrysophaeum taylorii]
MMLVLVLIITPCRGVLVFRNQARYLVAAAERCLASNTSAAEAVRRLRRSRECPARWAVTCLDHFNCDAMLRDVSEPLGDALRELGLDVVSGRASACVREVPDCGARQHLVLNANLMDPRWAEVLPRSLVLLNLEQLVSRSIDEARRAALAAVEVYARDDAVAGAGRRALAALAAADGNAIGATVDDRRGFVALDDAARAYPWLDYSYANVDLARVLWHPCVFAKGVGTATSRSKVGSVGEPAFLYATDDTPEDLRRRAEAFVSSRGLTAGAGCATAACVTATLFDAAAETLIAPSSSTRTAPTLDAVHLGGIGVPRRVRVVEALQQRARAAAVLEGYFGAARDEALAAARLGLAIHRHHDRKVAEVVRILVYAKAGLPVVAEAGSDTLLENELAADHPVFFVPYDGLVESAIALLDATEENATALKARNLATVRQERYMLAPILAFLFPACVPRIRRTGLFPPSFLAAALAINAASPPR